MMLEEEEEMGVEEEMDEEEMDEEEEEMGEKMGVEMMESKNKERRTS